MPKVPLVSEAFSGQDIHQAVEASERAHLAALAAPMLEWTPGLDGRHYPDLSLAWMRAHGWAAAVKVWVDAKGNDERAWCAAARLVTSATELVAVFPEDATFAGERMYRVPLAPEALRRLLEPYFYMSGLLFPEDRSFALAKDDGYTLVLAGPPAFVRAAVPEGVEAAWAEYTSYIEGEVLEPGLSQLLRLMGQYRALSGGLA